jgi:hypothetical protein
LLLLLLLLLFLTVEVDPVTGIEKDEKGGETEPEQTKHSKIVHADWQISKTGHFVGIG